MQDPLDLMNGYQQLRTKNLQTIPANQPVDISSNLGSGELESGKETMGSEGWEVVERKKPMIAKLNKIWVLSVLYLAAILSRGRIIMDS